MPHPIPPPPYPPTSKLDAILARLEDLARQVAVEAARAAERGALLQEVREDVSELKEEVAVLKSKANASGTSGAHHKAVTIGASAGGIGAIAMVVQEILKLWR